MLFFFSEHELLLNFVYTWEDKNTKSRLKRMAFLLQPREASPFGSPEATGVGYKPSNCWVPRPASLGFKIKLHCFACLYLKNSEDCNNI